MQLGSSQDVSRQKESQLADFRSRCWRRGQSNHRAFRWRSQCKTLAITFCRPQTDVIAKLTLAISAFYLIQPDYRLKVDVVDHDRLSSNDDVDQFDVLMTANKELQTRDVNQRTR